MTPAIHYINANDSSQLQTIPKQAIYLNLNYDTDEALILNKATLLSALATACGFPDYCHANWDSAFDCLTDNEVTNLILDLTKVTDLNYEDLHIFKELIADAHADYGKPKLWIVTTASDA